MVSKMAVKMDDWRDVYWADPLVYWRVVWTAFPLVEKKDDSTVAKMVGQSALQSAELKVYLKAEMLVYQMPNHHSILQTVYRGNIQEYVALLSSINYIVASAIG
jgi:hypothetical protein